MNANIIGLIIGLVIAVITVVLILLGNKEPRAAVAPEDEEEPAPQAVAKPVETPVEDDLVIIEGIGPKVAGILKQNGIRTFAQLAATPVPALQKILQDNGLRFLKPDSWPEQGRLAAAGQMEELKALQDKLVAGR